MDAGSNKERASPLIDLRSMLPQEHNLSLAIEKADTLRQELSLLFVSSYGVKPKVF